MTAIEGRNGSDAAKTLGMTIGRVSRTQPCDEPTEGIGAGNWR